jgi:hypothetical protein
MVESEGLREEEEGCVTFQVELGGGHLSHTESAILMPSHDVGDIATACQSE